MPLYMTQFSYTQEAWAEMTDQPSDVAARAAALLESMGGRLLSFHFCFGEYDGVSIYEAPSANEALASIIAGVAHGHVRQSKTTELFPMDSMLAALKTAGSLRFHKPGG